MNEEIGKLLDKEIAAELSGLAELPDGSDEKSAAINDVAVLYKLRQTEIDNVRGKNEQVKERCVRLVIAAGEIGLPLIFYGVWMRRGFEFEKVGTYTSKTFINLFNRFKPTKK